MTVIERLKADYDFQGDLEDVILGLQEIATAHKLKYKRVFLIWEGYGYDGGGDYHIMGEREETEKECSARLAKLEKAKVKRLEELEKRHKALEKEKAKIEKELKKHVK